MPVYKSKQLETRLRAINSAWSTENYQALLDFYIESLPTLFNCDRCGIFILDGSRNILRSAAGTHLAEGDLEIPVLGTVAGEVVTTKQVLLDNQFKLNADIHNKILEKTGYTANTILCAPLFSAVDQQVLGVVQLLNKNPAPSSRGFEQQDSAYLQKVAKFIAMAIESLVVGRDLLKLNQQLQREISRLQGADGQLIAESESMRLLIEQAKTIATVPVSILITGENGTGKEQIAKLVHQSSDRSNKPFIAINCAAIPENLVESELFGYEKGAFTGANKSHAGKFEQAKGGTLFLDEVGELPLSIQPKLLRAIQEQEGQRLGATETTKYNFRLLCATNQDLQGMIEQGLFREDLYYRLFSVQLHIPPLNKRPEDIIALTNFFASEVAKQFNKQPGPLSGELLQRFENYHWPGNVRQLRREVERVVALTQEHKPITTEFCSLELQTRKAMIKVNVESTLAAQVSDLEIQLIKSALDRSRGNKVKAAQMLGLSRPGLYKKLRRYGLEPE